MAHLYDVCEPGVLSEMLETRMVKVQRHPTLDLSIYNYTQLCAFHGQWNDVTRACRGLIVDRDGFVVARPFAKFFNLAEHDGSALPSGPVHVTDKLDGSLGIIYRDDNSWAVATRGSFTSDQALHASAVLKSRYSTAQLRPDWTYLTEVIYPQNRIVVDYGDLDDLVLLGAVDTETGRSVPLEAAGASWPGPVVEQFDYSSLEEALAAPERPGAEGLVVHFVDADIRVKVKQDDYVRLHRLVTGVSERRVWEALSQGLDLSQWLEAVPDEFFTFVTSTRDRMLSEHAASVADLESRLVELQARLGDAPRKEYAEHIMAMRDYPLHRGLFSLLDGKSVSDLVWRSLRPVEHVPVWNRTEDNA